MKQNIMELAQPVIASMEAKFKEKETDEAKKQETNEAQKITVVKPKNPQNDKLDIKETASISEEYLQDTLKQF